MLDFVKAPRRPLTQRLRYAATALAQAVYRLWMERGIVRELRQLERLGYTVRVTKNNLFTPLPDEGFIYASGRNYVFHTYSLMQEPLPEAHMVIHEIIDKESHALMEVRIVGGPKGGVVFIARKLSRLLPWERTLMHLKQMHDAMEENARLDYRGSRNYR